MSKLPEELMQKLKLGKLDELRKMGKEAIKGKLPKGKGKGVAVMTMHVAEGRPIEEPKKAEDFRDSDELNQGMDLSELAEKPMTEDQVAAAPEESEGETSQEVDAQDEPADESSEHEDSESPEEEAVEPADDSEASLSDAKIPPEVMKLVMEMLKKKLEGGNGLS